MKKIFFLINSLFFAVILQAQPSNDNCDNAIFISNIESFCSKVGEFKNDGATSSSLITPCFGPIQKDVWFAFVPNKTDVNITVKGAIGVAGTGGTLRFPQVALYTGDCISNPSELICDKAGGTNHLVSIYKGGLVVGETYYIRIQGGGGQVGTFQLCIENYNPPKEPSGDCPTASVLCDKSPFVVQSVTGAGKDNEITAKDAPCFSNGAAGNIESNSTWFKWTCEKAGTLTFVLTPLRGEDDIDFVVFELPNGIDNCAGKKNLRCMASGETSGGCKLLGPTGLRIGSTDVSEDSGCSAGKDNFLAPLDMELGKTYAIMINNFTSTKSGFKMEFGGSSTFVGPQAIFTSNSLTKKLCYGEKIEFKDESKTSGGTSKIVKWSWDFGVGGSPRKKEDLSAGAKHDVVYNTPGKRYVVLTIESDKGCQVTAIDTFVVDSCCQTRNKLNINPLVKNLQCQDILEGSVDLNVTSISQPTTYKWSYGATTPSISGLGTGKYAVTITNAANCKLGLYLDITAPPPIVTDTIIKRPTCDGGQDGVITLNPRGGISPYTFDWGNGYVPINTLGNLPVGKYPVFIKDQGGCQKLINVNLRELELDLDPAVEAFRLPRCFGSTDGSIDLKVINGAAPFEYDFGTGFQSSKTLNNIGAGKYNVTVKDANRCKGIYTFDIGQPELLKAVLDSVLISCYGANDGQLFAKAEGGTPGYGFSWNNNQNIENIEKLAPGTYILTITDKNACTTTTSITLGQPPRLDIAINGVKDVVCYNDKTGELDFSGKGGRPPYQYSLDGVIFQKATTFEKLAAGDYSIVVKDTAGCEVSLPVTVAQPTPFVINAGKDQTIELGDEAQINAVVLPSSTLVKSLVWTPDATLSCKNCLDPTASPLKTITYTIKGIDITDCPATDKITIFVNNSRKIYVPNIFSPLDANGTNDHFIALAGRSAKQINLMRIYDRWGELVYEGKNLPLNETGKGWDGNFKGEKVSKGIFTYYIIVEYIDGSLDERRGDIMVF